MKRALIPVTTLLMLFVVTPVIAAPAAKIPFTSEVNIGFGSVSLGKEWTTEEGIYHFKGAISEGTAEIHSILGDMSGTMMMVHDLALDLNTGHGQCHGKFVLTVDGMGTFEGSEHGTHTITDGHYIAGGLVAKGTGMFEGLKMMALYEGEIFTVDTHQEVVAEMEGTLLSPKG